MIKLCLFSTLLCLCAGVSVSSDEVDDIVRTELKRQNIPGISIAVCRQGKIIKEAGYGFTNLEHPPET